MTDKTIGSIASSVSELAGADLAEVEQGGVSKKTTFQKVMDLAYTSMNRLMNGDWLIDQLNEGALYTISGASAVQGPDGWSASNTNGAGVFKLRTLADPDNAALKCLEISCTTADASIAAGDAYYIYTAVEGYDVADLNIGTALADTVTVRFKFKTNVTGVYGVSLVNSAANRSRVEIITVANTAENEYTLTFPLDQSGTWLYTNGVGLHLRICLSAGSNFQTTASAWGANNMLTTSAQANFMSVNTNISYLKRVRLVSGTEALGGSYGPQDYKKALAKCQRYFFKTYNQGVVPATASSVGARGCSATGTASGTATCQIQFPVHMRATPTIIFYSPTTGATGNWRRSTGAADVGFVDSGLIGMSGVCGNNNAAVTATEIVFGHVTANARLS